ncbi:YciI family protein [Nocardioides sp.]|uniref:YciI family protein n=1 Tax=Nocardioides sp. TaxID=35761 RepID=UPI0035294E59
MKFVIMIHSHPAPWGHPTGDFTPEFQAIPEEQRAQMGVEFDALLAELHGNGELVLGEALADPRAASLYRWGADGPIASDGPFAETKEQFAGFFLIDVADRARAEAVAARFAAPGDTIELRPAMWPGADDS